MEMVVNDPDHLTAPWTLGWGKFAEKDYEFIENDCEVPIGLEDAESFLEQLQ